MTDAAITSAEVRFHGELQWEWNAANPAFSFSDERDVDASRSASSR